MQSLRISPREFPLFNKKYIFPNHNSPFTHLEFRRDHLAQTDGRHNAEIPDAHGHRWLHIVPLGTMRGCISGRDAHINIPHTGENDLIPETMILQEGQPLHIHRTLEDRQLRRVRDEGPQQRVERGGPLVLDAHPVRRLLKMIPG